VGSLDVIIGVLVGLAVILLFVFFGR